MNTQRPRASGTSPSLDVVAQSDDVLQARLSQIRHRLIVLSGKGGVGKSTVAVNLAMAFASAGHSVGLLDVDVHGPSVPKLLGLEGRVPDDDNGGLYPIFLTPKLRVMSVGFLVKGADDAVVWRGPLKYNVIRQLLRDVNWGPLDYLIVDSPPGTGDEPLAVAQLIGKPAAAVVVTTPQDVAVADVRRSITFCRRVSLSVAGIIENMSGYVCPHCGEVTEPFKSGGGEALAHEMNVPFLGRVPLDPAVVRSGDSGHPLTGQSADGPAASAFVPIVAAVENAILNS
jgi:ATP-binding protein involved in chromosome partitioning